MHLRSSHVLIGLSIFAALWFLWPQAQKPSNIASTQAPVEAAAVKPPVQAASPRGVAEPAQNPTVVENTALENLDLPPLPAPDLPLAVSQSALVKRAQAGDLPAAMRLLDESKCCGTRNITTHYLLNIRPTDLDAEETKFYDNFVIGMKTHEQTMQQRCGDIKKTSIDIKAARKWARAAGDPLSVIEFARSSPLFGVSIADHIQHLQERQRDAIPSLHRLVSQGNLDAVMVLASLHATPSVHGDLGSLVQQDIETAAVYDMLYLRAGGRAYRARMEFFMAQMNTRLTSEQLTLAKARALEIYNAAFAGRTTSEYGIASVAPGLLQETGFAADARYPGASACPILPGTQTEMQSSMMLRIIAKIRPTGAMRPGSTTPQR